MVIGHLVRDLVPGGWRLGGTAAFAAVQAHRLGLRSGVVTSVGPDVAVEKELPGMSFANRKSRVSTTFHNLYEGARRRQLVPEQAEPIRAEDVPQEWRRAAAVLLGPVCGELALGLPGVFEEALVGVTAQGWLRELDEQGEVRPRAWVGAPFWAGCDVLFVSEEDLGVGQGQLERWEDEVPVVVVTAAERGARVHDSEGWRAIGALPADEIDATGAGDVFASAFLVKYQETRTVAEAARFASAAAAASVEAVGFEGVANREEVASRMAQHPEVVLR